MGKLEIVLWILILAAPVLSRWFKKRKGSTSPSQHPGPHPEREVRESTPIEGRTPKRQLTPFEEALRQIQGALEDGKDQRAEPPATKPMPQQLPAEPQSRRLVKDQKAPAARPPSLFERADLQARRRSGKADPEFRKEVVKESAQYGFKQAADDSFKHFSYDEAFESKAPYGESFHDTVHSHVPASPKEPRHRVSKPTRSKWQQAYVLREVLGSARSRHPWRNRMSR